MGKLKPILAALGTCALALGLIALWGVLSPGRSPGENAAPANAPDSNRAPSGLAYEIVTLEELPPGEPAYLWPRNGQRVASPDVWVIWETFEVSRCRLLARHDANLWYDIGSSVGTRHALVLNLSDFKSTAVFCLDFEQYGKRYRSAPRTVTFARGARFEQRRVEFSTAPGQQSWPLNLLGADPARLTGDSFVNALFPDSVTVFALPRPGTAQGGVVDVGITEGQGVPAGGCTGYLEVHDTAADTVDRIQIALKPR